MMAVLSFTMVAGRFIRKRVKKELKILCFNNDLNLQIEEEKHFTESDFFIKISGNINHIIELIPILKKQFMRINEENYDK